MFHNLGFFVAFNIKDAKKTTTKIEKEKKKVIIAIINIPKKVN